MHIIAAKAVCFKEALTPEFRTYQQQIVEERRAARGAHSPQAGFRLVSGGTDNHLMLVDVFSRGLTGKVAEAALGRAGITVNKNAIPFDQNPPMTASGIRIGTPAVTTRGMREPEMDQIAALIARVLGGAGRRERRDGACGADVRALCRKFPLYPDLAPRDACARPRRARARRRRPARRARSTASSRGPASGTGRGGRARRSSTAARSSPKPARAPARRSPTSCPPCSPAAACSISTGTRTLQDQIFYKDVPALARALGIDDPRGLHEGPHELPLPAPIRAAARSRGGTAARRAAVARSASRSGPARPPTGDRGEIEDLPDDLPLWSELTATSEQCLGRECPQLRRLLRHAHARARGRGRASSSSTTTCCARTRRCGRANSARSFPTAMSPSSTRRTSSRTSSRSTSACRSSTYRIDEFGARCARPAVGAVPGRGRPLRGRRRARAQRRAAGRAPAVRRRAASSCGGSDGSGDRVTLSADGGRAAERRRHRARRMRWIGLASRIVRRRRRCPTDLASIGACAPRRCATT